MLTVAYIKGKHSCLLLCDLVIMGKKECHHQNINRCEYKRQETPENVSPDKYHWVTCNV